MRMMKKRNRRTRTAVLMLPDESVVLIMEKLSGQVGCNGEVLQLSLQGASAEAQQLGRLGAVAVGVPESPMDRARLEGIQVKFPPERKVVFPGGDAWPGMGDGGRIERAGPGLRGRRAGAGGQFRPGWT